MKKMILLILSFILLLTLSGCGSASDVVQTIESETAKLQTGQTQAAEFQTAQSQTSESSDTTQETDLTFADLSGYVFEFSSGVGAWATELTIEKDGYFHGQYYDSDMGDSGEGYNNGTVYSSVFSGHFTDLTKTDDTVWTLKLADISYQNAVGETRMDVVDKIRYIYTDAHGLGTAMQVYWKGTSIADLPEDEMSWVGHSLENAGGDRTLTRPVIADAATGEAFSSYERQTPYEEAGTLLDLYQSFYDKSEAALQQATTQSDMNACAQKMYENSDDCLNHIWILVKYNTDEDKFAAILEEQRAWIAEKEAAQKSISEEWGGGSGEPLAVYTVLAEMTMERCKVLTEYLAIRD